MTSGARRHLTFVFDEGELGEIATVRRRWDPVMAEGVPPHVTLVYPEEFGDLDLLLERARVAGAAVGPFSLVAAEVVVVDGGSGGVFLSVRDASGSWDKLREALLAPPFRRSDVPAHLTLVHPRTSDRGPAAGRELEGWRPAAALLVREISYTETSVEIGMRVVERFPMRGHRRDLCVGVVLVDVSSVLLAQRSHDRSWYPGVWDLPGGHVEPGESLVAAAAREAREELGVDVSPSGCRYVDTIVGDDYELVVFAVASWTGAVTNAAPEEHEQIRWFAADETSGLELSDPRLPRLAERAVAAVS